METIFLRICNMSITASWLILAVIGIRFFMKKVKVPKWIVCILWAMVSVRLICPFSLESIVSLIPNTGIIVQNQKADTGISVVDQIANPILSEMTVQNTVPKWSSIAAYVWIVGVLLMVAYAFLSYFKLGKKVKLSINLQENVWICDEIGTPFVFGVLSPKIYLPSHMDEKWLSSVLHHEQTHIRRYDHWWKLLGYLLLAVYWFNPLVWIAYALFGNDIEMACDESVIKDIDGKEKKNYSEALLGCSISGKRRIACPLAFGEDDVKERIRFVLNYKKPTFGITCFALVVCLVCGVCLLTNRPKESYELEKSYEQAMVPYKKNSDGTWSADGYNYKYRKVLQGREKNAAEDTIFVVLTNDRNVTFKEVSESILSSNSEDQFEKEELRIVEIE